MGLTDCEFLPSTPENLTYARALASTGKGEGLTAYPDKPFESQSIPLMGEIFPYGYQVHRRLSRREVKTSSTSHKKDLAEFMSAL